MSTTQTQSYPVSDIDIFDISVSLNPYEAYRELRNLGSVVWVTSGDYWAITRYDDIKAVLRNHEVFISGKGTGHNAMPDLPVDPGSKAPIAGKVVLASDPPDHERLRGHLIDKLSPVAMRKLRPTIQQKVDGIIDAVLEEPTFDAIPTIAQAVPMKVVGDLMGLPEEGRDLLLKGADAVFSSFAPFSPAIQERFPYALAYFEWINDVAAQGIFTPGSWGEALNDAVIRGQMSREEMTATISAFLVAGFDTTVNSIAASLRFFAEDPDLWRTLQDDAARVPAVFEETVRLESPVVAFFRRTSRETEIDGVTIPADARVLVVFASGNRDERHYPDPDRFRIERNPVDHLAMGSGIHACAGGALARVEAISVTSALLQRIETIELAGEPVRRYNPIVRGLESLPLSVTLKDRP